MKLRRPRPRIPTEIIIILPIFRRQVIRKEIIVSSEQRTQTNVDFAIRETNRSKNIT